MDGDFIDSAAFRLAIKDGELEKGLSINWVEYFGKPHPRDVIAPLRMILSKKRTIGGQSKFALLNVGAVKAAAARYAAVAVVRDEEPEDLSHALVIGYDDYNDQVSEEIRKVVIDTFPAKA